MKISDLAVQIGPCVGGYSRRVMTEDGPVEEWVEYVYIQAETSKGHRWVLPEVSFKSMDEAGFFARTVDFNADTWLQQPAAYGSEAWGPEDDRELARFEAECYDEPVPAWAM